jgi:hypothetical protein
MKPAFFENPEQLQEKIDLYFESHEKHYIEGLVLFLGFSTRQSLYDYAKNPDFKHIIEYARTRVRLCYEKDLRASGIKPTGSIFALKCMGWQEQAPKEIDSDDETKESQSATNRLIEYLDSVAKK